MSDGCKAKVWSVDGWHQYPCSRNAKKDGYCTQHHPNNVEKRRKASEEREQKAYENSPLQRTIRAESKLKELEAENVSLSRMVASQDEGLAELEAQLEAVKVLKKEFFDNPWIYVSRHEVYAKIDKALKDSGVVE